MKLRLNQGLLHYSNLLLGCCLVIAGILIWGTFTQIEKNHEFERQVLEQEAQIVLLDQQIKNQELLNEFFKTDYYLDISAKKQLGVVSPGETVYKINRENLVKEKEDYEKTMVTPSNKASLSVSNLTNWWRFFQGKAPTD